MKEAILMFALAVFMSQAPAFAQAGRSEASKPLTAKCPVTGVEHIVKPGDARSKYKGKNYSFCCPACKPKFDANPEKYLKQG